MWKINFFIFFSNLRNFFLVLKERSKVTKLEYVFTRRLHTTLKKILDNWSKQFANPTQTFFDKRGFQKLEKNLRKIHMYSDKLTNKLRLKYNNFTRFFYEEFFFHYFVNNCWELLICKISFLSTFWMFDFLKIFVSSGRIQNILQIALLAGNLTRHPP